MTSGEDFFGAMEEQSHVKVEIVEKYFSAWANVILPSVEAKDGKLGYIDLFSGPGIYDDGTKSTPILILEKAISDPRLRIRLVTIFNDSNEQFLKTLKLNIHKLKGINLLKNKPILLKDTVGDQLATILKKINFIPSLFFIDPWGYKGLSISLLGAVLKDWGCDCILFFNYNRINMGLNNPYFIKNMKALFGEERAEKLRKRLTKLSPKERELSIIEEFGIAINDMGFRYTLPFCFKDESGKKTSHYIIFISKNEKGYGIMKNIMAKYSSELTQGVPSFQYCAATIKQQFLFSFNRPLDDLSQMLLDEFKGQSLSMGEIFRLHNIGKPFIERNYKDILCQMERKGLIKADPPWSKRRKNTFAPHVLVIFPEN